MSNNPLEKEALRSLKGRSPSRYHVTLNVIKRGIAHFLTDPDTLHQVMDSILEYRQSVVSTQQDADAFSMHAIEAFAEYYIEDDTLSAAQQILLLTAIRLLSKAHQPRYTCVNPSVYSNYKPEHSTGAEYAQRMLAMLTTYFPDFDINGKADGSQNTLMTCLMSRFGETAEFKLAAAAVWVNHGADLHATYREHGNILQQISCIKHDSLDLVVGLVNMGADPFLQSPFQTPTGHSFVGDYNKVPYSSYFDYVEEMHHYQDPSREESSDGRYLDRKENAAKVYQFLKQLQLSNYAINDCNQSLTHQERKSNHSI